MFTMPNPTTLLEAQALIKDAQAARERLLEARSTVGPDRYPELRMLFVDITGLAAELEAIEDHAREVLAGFPQS